MRMKRQSPLKKKSKRGFRGYPIATIMFYGPTDQRATKVAAEIIAYEGADAKPLMRWWSEEEAAESSFRLVLIICRKLRSEMGGRSINSVDDCR
jgi:hypothetical protein